MFVTIAFVLTPALKTSFVYLRLTVYASSTLLLTENAPSRSGTSSSPYVISWSFAVTVIRRGFTVTHAQFVTG